MWQCITGIAKYIIFVINFVILVFGALMILFGILPIVHGGYDSEYSKVAIGFGVVVFIISFLGCCGAVRENRTLLTAHAIILLVLFVLQVVLAILIALAIGNGYFDDAEMDKSLDKIFHSANKDDHKAFEQLERYLKCCGVRNVTVDYDPNKIPAACCGYTDDTNANKQRTCTIGVAYKVGCAEALSEYFESNHKWIIGIAIGFGIFEICAAAFTFWTRDHLCHHHDHY